MKNYGVLIVGAGVAGITASIYCARANLKVALIDKSIIGGNLNNYMNIENYPAFFGETSDLVDKLQEHIEKYSDNIDIYEFEEIEHVDLQNKVVKTKNNEFQGKYIIIATGSKPKMLNVPGEKEFIGNGVHYCAICDGILYKDKTVAVIGGGNSACEEALGLSKICEQVNIIEFTDKLNADKTTVDRIYNTKNISVSLNCQVTKITGNDKVERIWFKDKGSSYDCYFDVDGVFPYIGMSPCSPIIKNKPLVFTNNDGYIYVNESMQTPIRDIYAVGDITVKNYRQVVTAISDGAIAGIHISKRL